MTPTLNPMKRHHERCREVRAQMSDYLDGELEPADAAAVERHTGWCPNCRRMLSNLRRTLGGLRALRDQPTPVDRPASHG
jgi:anti-sigma factor RsiW